MKNVVLTLCLVIATVTTFADDAIKVSDPWIREPNPARSIAAAFMTLENLTDEPIVLEGARSEAAEVVEIHEMKTVDGVMKMRMLDKLVIEPHSSVKLAPGGFHLMMINLTKKLHSGDTATIVLEVEDGKTITVDAPVKRPGEND